MSRIRKKFRTPSHVTSNPTQTKEPNLNPRLPWNYSPPSLQVEGTNGVNSLFSIEIQWTVRTKVELSKKEMTLLGSLALRKVCSNGITLVDWIILEYLYSSLLGEKRSPLEIRSNKEDILPDHLRLEIRRRREIAYLLKLVLLSVDTSNLFEGKISIPFSILQQVEISEYVPSERTLRSWESHYSLDKFLKFGTVPLDTFLERRKDSVRYSSYCKGYGESSHMGRRKKTRPSAELDGDDTWLGDHLVLDPQEKYRLLSLFQEEQKIKYYRKL